jgi:hypothetical protein
MLFRPLLLSALALLALTAPSLADEQFRLFSCNTDDEVYQSGIELYGNQHDDGTWSDLQFWVNHAGIVTRQFADDFYFSNSEGPEGYYAQVRFDQGERGFVLHMLDIPPDPTDENDMGGRIAGLTIIEADGGISELPCHETDEYIGYMAEAMHCDMLNRYGAAGCDFDIRPTRTPDDILPSDYTF